MISAQGQKRFFDAFGADETIHTNIFAFNCCFIKNFQNLDEQYLTPYTRILLLIAFYEKIPANRKKIQNGAFVTV